MALESLQNMFSAIILLCAGAAAIAGMFFVSLLLKKQSKKVDSVLFFTFVFLSAGYIFLALGELTRYLIFSVFGQPPTISMPDIYWVTALLSILTGYIILAVNLHKNYGSGNKLMYLGLVVLVVVGVVFFYLSSVNFFQDAESLGEKFISFFYPIFSGLILITSINLYFFMDKVQAFSKGLLFFVAGNAFTLVGDMCYNYYNYVQSAYGTFGLTIDFLYIGAYSLYAIAFIALILQFREMHEGNEVLKWS
jgi:hypothetical protein